MITVLKIMGKVKIGSVFLLLGIVFLIHPPAALTAQEHPFSEARWKKPTGGRVLSVSSSLRYRWIYALSEDRTLHCITPSGTLLWQSERLPNRPTGSAVIGPDESIYVHTSRGDLYAFNPAGRIIWSVGLSGTVIGELSVDEEGILYYATSAGMVAARNHLGKLIWKRELDAAALTPVRYDGDGLLWVLLEDETVLSMSRDGGIMARINLNDPLAASGDRQRAGAGAPYLACDQEGVYVSVSGRIITWDASGKYRWNAEVDGRITASVLNNGLLFIGTSSGRVYAFETSTGYIRWSQKIPASIEFLNVPAGADRLLIAAGKFTAYLLNPFGGEVLLNFSKPASAGQPLMNRNDILYIGGDDWVVYQYDLPRPDIAAANPSRERSAGDGQRNDFGVREMSARELYTAEIMKTADRAEYLRLLDDLDTVLRSVDPGIQYLSSLRSVEVLSGTGVLNPITRSGYVINDFPEIRIRAASLLAQYGTLQSRDVLLQLLRYDWDNVASQTIVESLGMLRSDPDGEVVAAVYRLLHSGRIPLGENVTTVDTIIESIDRICRYSGMVRPEASGVLNELYFASIPREYRMKAIETLRAFGEKK